jgi:translocator protein
MNPDYDSDFDTEPAERMGTVVENSDPFGTRRATQPRETRQMLIETPTQVEPRENQMRIIGSKFLYDPKFYVFLGLTALIAYAGSAITMKSIQDGFYQTLKKPAWAPNSNVISTIWLILYFLIAYTTYRAYHFANKEQKYMLGWIFVIQIVLNFAWSWAFFGLKSPKTAFYIILLLLLVIFVQMMYMYYIDPISAYVFSLYFIWVSFAAGLNYEIIQLNTI